MEKMDIINNIVCDMTGKISYEELAQLKTVLVFRLTGFQLMKEETHLSTEIVDNHYIMERYAIDLTAQGRKKSTIENYLIIIRKFFFDTGMDYRNVTGQNVMDYIARRIVKDGISKAYASTLQRYISAFFTWAYRKKHIRTDIALDIDKIKAPKKHKDRLTNDEVEKCRQAVKNDLRASALLETMLSAGPRVGEIANMDIKQLDFERGEIHIYGEKTSEWRTCFMTPRFKVVMRDYLAGRTTGPVFIGLRGKGRMNRSTLEGISKEISFSAGCHCKATVHVYRKTFATREYFRTKDILYVSKRLGHANIETTRKFYIADDIEMDRMMSMTA